MKEFATIFIAVLFLMLYAEEDNPWSDAVEETVAEETVPVENAEEVDKEVTAENNEIKPIDTEETEEEVKIEEKISEEVIVEEKEQIAEEKITEENEINGPVVEKKKVEEKAAEEDIVVDEGKPEKINIAVFDLQNRGMFNTGEIKFITDRINSEVHKIERFILVERQQIGAILKEQGFQQTGACSDQECLVEAGQLLAVKKIIGGSIGKLEGIFPVTLKILDVRTGKVEAQVIKDYKGSKEKLLSEFIPEITHALLVDAGYIEEIVEQKKIISKPAFWVPAIAVVSGGVVAAILLSQKDKADDEGELDFSFFPDHNIVIGE